MRQISVSCTCFLGLFFLTPVSVMGAVKYSIYDEFGRAIPQDQRYKNSFEGNDQFEVLSIGQEQLLDMDFSKWRYRNPRLSEEKKSSTLYKKPISKSLRKRYRTDNHWKYRPIEKKKEKQVIKIEELQVKPLVIPKMMPKMFYPVLPY